MAKRDLKNLLADLQSDKAPRLLLVFGDDLQVEEACNAIVDELVPAERRGFNFERFDGRTAAWDEIEGSLRTPPFFPGKKLLWVENPPYFFSREQKGEAGEKILKLIESLDDSDDVQNVYANFEVSDALMQKMSA